MDLFTYLSLTKSPSTAESGTISHISSPYLIIHYIGVFRLFVCNLLILSILLFQIAILYALIRSHPFADRSLILHTGQLGTASWGRVSVRMSRTPGVDSCIFPSIRSTSCSSGRPWSPRLFDDDHHQTNGSCVQFLGAGVQPTPNSAVQTARPGLVICKLHCFFEGRWKLLKVLIKFRFVSSVSAESVLCS